MDRIEISSPYINKADAMANIEEAIETGQIAQGRQVKLAETALKSELHSKYAAMLSNGTASLKAALVASIAEKRNIDKKYIDRDLKNSEIIIPAYSFNATLNTVLQVGATARVVDISKEDYCIDRNAVREAIGENTTAIMPVDLYGQAADISTQYEDFSELAIVRDSAQAHGAKLNNDPIVEHSDATSLSFYPTKNVSAPEGGAVISNNVNIDQIVRIYRNQGMSERYVYDMLGDNLRMTDIHAAVLRANLGSLAYINAKRQENAQNLTTALQDIEGVFTPKVMKDRHHVWHQYTILVEEEFGLDRDQLASKLDERGIGSGVYYPKIMTDHEMFVDHPRIISESTPIATEVASKALSLPVHPGVSTNDIDRIKQSIEDIKKGK